MKTLIVSLFSSLYLVWIIGTKDILDALKNKSSRTNILIIMGIVVFFYWLGVLRPFDKDVSVVVLDEGRSGLMLESVKLGDGARYTFRKAASLADMQRKMANQSLGLVLPASLTAIRTSGGTPILQGHIFWADRMKAPQLEAQYSQAFSEILGGPVQVVIDQNILIPPVDADGMQTTVAYQMAYAIFWTALILIPHLILEEKDNKTLDALLTSPASPGQVILGKALAGFFYILVIGGLALALYAMFIVDWGLALAAFLGYILFAVGLALTIGSFIRSRQQLMLWSVVLIFFLVIPPLFFMEPNLKSGMRTVLTWLPSSALSSLFRFSLTSGVTPAQFLPNLAIALGSIGALFGLVIWKVGRSDR
jgi:ABC-type transport system involved in multi-copper enzyme maturation permease subunit